MRVRASVSFKADPEPPQWVMDLYTVKGAKWVLGLAVGLVVALIGAPYLFGSVFETSPRDIRTYVQVATMQLAVALLATYIPVSRAGENPSEALTVRLTSRGDRLSLFYHRRRLTALDPVPWTV